MKIVLIILAIGVGIILMNHGTVAVIENTKLVRVLNGAKYEMACLKVANVFVCITTALAIAIASFIMLLVNFT